MKAGFSNLEKTMMYVSPEPNTGCWLWTGSVCPDGYAMVHERQSQEGLKTQFKRKRAHRFLYEELIGPVPEGLELDHLCRVRCCVNPQHLEPVTHAENVKRGESGKQFSSLTHCKQGHKFSTENTRIRPTGGRSCRACEKIRKLKGVIA